MSSDANADQIAHWNGAAGESWAKLEDRMDRQLDPIGAHALTALALQHGERVIDIGCGCGNTTLAIKQAVGAFGVALGIDVSLPMLAVARERGADHGVEYAQADAQTYVFAPGAYDAAFSRFGVMFFEDPEAAFANIADALSDTGRIAFVCWRPLAENPWMTVPLAAAMSVLPPPAPPTPGAPGPFAFADPERVRVLLAGAGFGDIDIAPIDTTMGDGGNVDSAVELALRAGPLATLLREHPDQRDAVAQAVHAALAPHDGPQGVRLPAAVWRVGARKG